MICFPNAKINLGLYVTGKRTDGFHDIETIFYPVPLKDALEITASSETELLQSGLAIDTAPEKNLVMKAYKMLSEGRNVPPLKIFLRKAIPFGAGLGGGSSDAAFMLKLVNAYGRLQCSTAELEEMAAAIGADCPFFIQNRPVIAKGIGNKFAEINLSLKGYHICIVKPPFSVSTKDAYAGITPRESNISWEDLPLIPVREWRNVLANDFERIVFGKLLEIKYLKERMYELGAEYASMSGSGSAVFGLFKQPVASDFPDCFVWKGILE